IVCVCVGAAVLLSLVVALQAFAIEKKGDVFKKMACPAFLVCVCVAYLADMTLELPCKCVCVCVSSVVWYFQKNLRSHVCVCVTDFNGTMVVDSSHIRAGSDLLKRFSIRMFSLIVFRAQVRDSGHYLCGTKDGLFFYGYDVDVQPTRQITVAFLDNDQHVQKDYTKKEFTLFTTFWDWTSCDRCGVRGEQRVCVCVYVQSAQLSPRYRTAVCVCVSCGSRAVPAHFQRLVCVCVPEVAIRSCLAPCPEKEVPEEGVQSVSNIVYKLGVCVCVPRVPIQYHRQPSQSVCVCVCPGARPEHAVAWDNVCVCVYHSHYLVGVRKHMSVCVCVGNHLHLRRVRRRDSVCVCVWREGELVAGFQLSVVCVCVRQRSPSDPESIFVMRAVGISFAVITGIFFLIHVVCVCVQAFRRPARL
ncbi:F187A protein, partial [Chaetorhynchus papuensis]|nr:F187A protein [Chaetorhynchus papuensis]